MSELLPCFCRAGSMHSSRLKHLESCPAYYREQVEQELAKKGALAKFWRDAHDNLAERFDKQDEEHAEALRKAVEAMRDRCADLMRDMGYARGAAAIRGIEVN